MSDKTRLVFISNTRPSIADFAYWQNGYMKVAVLGTGLSTDWCSFVGTGNELRATPNNEQVNTIADEILALFAPINDDTIVYVRGQAKILDAIRALAKVRGLELISE